MGLKFDIQECIDDTKRILGASTASRLHNLNQYDNEIDLINAICKIVSNDKNSANGFEIDRADGLSLEAIILRYPNKFPNDIVTRAERLLGKTRKYPQ